MGDGAPMNYAGAVKIGDPVKAALPKPEISSYKGELAINFPQPLVDFLAKPFRFALIGKFSRGRPHLDSIRKFLNVQNFAEKFSLGILNNKHVLINFSGERDYIRLYSKGIWQVTSKPMRILKWTPSFRVDIESSIVPIWIALPHLPAHLMNRDSIFAIVSGFGVPLRIDAATVDFRRPAMAKVRIEFDLLTTLPQRIWIRQGDLPGFWQMIQLDEELPDYCRFCSHIGHNENFCLVKHPELKQMKARDHAQQDRGNTSNTQAPQYQIIRRNSAEVIPVIDMTTAPIDLNLPIRQHVLEGTPQEEGPHGNLSQKLQVIEKQVEDICKEIDKAPVILNAVEGITHGESSQVEGTNSSTDQQIILVNNDPIKSPMVQRPGKEVAVEGDWKSYSKKGSTGKKSLRGIVINPISDMAIDDIEVEKTITEKQQTGPAQQYQILQREVPKVLPEQIFEEGVKLVTDSETPQKMDHERSGTSVVDVSFQNSNKGKESSGKGFEIIYGSKATMDSTTKSSGKENQFSIENELRYMNLDPKAQLGEYTFNKIFAGKFTPAKKITRTRKQKQILDL